MKETSRLGVAMAAMMVIGVASTAFASTINPTVDVTGTVQGKCTVKDNGAMSFTIDPSLAGPITAAVGTDASIFCTKSHPFTVTAASANKGGAAAACSSGGITGQLKSGSDTMDYTFTCAANSSGNGFGAGNAKALGIGGAIAKAAYENAPVGSGYTDTITFTITY